MTQKLNIDRIWWRNVQLGEFYNIERNPSSIEGGGGSLYIEIPGSLVTDTLKFLGFDGDGYASFPGITINASVVGQPDESGRIEFSKKEGGRMRISNQNRRQQNSQRHPAWIESRGFPIAPDDIRNKEEAHKSFPEGGLRIYIAKTVGGDFYAGFTKGPRPVDMHSNDPMWDLYPEVKIVGGIIYGT